MPSNDAIAAKGLAENSTRNRDAYFAIALQVLFVVLAGIYCFSMDWRFRSAWKHMAQLPLKQDWSVPPWLLVLLAIASACIVIAPVRPILGFIAYFMVLRGAPRYSDEFIWLHRTHAVEIFMILAFIAWGFWRLSNRSDHQLIRTWFFWTAVLFGTWIIAVEAFARFHRPEMNPFLFHGVIRGITAIGFGVMAVDLVRRGEDLVIVGVFTALIVYFRGWYFPDHVYLDGDLAVLLVTTLPMAMLAPIKRPRWVTVAFALSSAFITLYLLAMTQNRGGAIGLFCGLLALLVIVPWRYGIGTASIAFAAISFLFYLRPAYWIRFEDIWTGGDAAGSYLQRWEIWRLLQESLIEHIFFGVGMGRTGVTVAELSPEIGRLNAHNSWIQILHECGVPALVFYVALFTISMILAWRLARSKIVNTKCAGVACWCSLAAYFGIGFGHARECYELAYFVAGACSGMFLSMREGVTTDTAQIREVETNGP